MRSKSRPQRSGWIVKAVIPWFLAALLVSSTAIATQNPMETLAVGVMTSDIRARISTVAPMAASPHSASSEPSGRAGALTLVKRNIRPATGINVRSMLVPVGNRISAEVAFANEPGFLPRSFLQDGMRPATGAPTGRHFGRVTNADGTTSGAGRGDIVPSASRGVTSPVSLPIVTARRPDGASPSLPRAVALASTTPAPIEPEIVSMPAGMGPAVAIVQPHEVEDPEHPRPNYAELIDPQEMSREQRCLAEAVYFEARSEPAAGQAAVAQVVLNRVKSGLYPSSVCGVVYQNRNRYKACQFSFACEGKSLRVTEPAPWRQAVKIALDVTEGKTYLSKVGEALNYHADYVRPSWARSLKKNDTIGRHIFYSLRSSQR